MTNSQTKTHGILMSAPMILAYLAGRKNQTRRTRGLDKINENPDEWKFLEIKDGRTIFQSLSNLLPSGYLDFLGFRLPYGCVGDTLYFKETWMMWEREEDGKDFLHYRADDAKVDPLWWDEYEWKRPDPVWADHFEKWHSSMFMPRICSRFREIPILNVRLERLLDITEMDAMNEGLWNGWSATGPSDYHRNKYFELWDKLNGKTMPASKNPWVWVYDFPFYEKAS